MKRLDAPKRLALPPCSHAERRTVYPHGESPPTDFPELVGTTTYFRECVACGDVLVFKAWFMRA